MRSHGAVCNRHLQPAHRAYGVGAGEAAQAERPGCHIAKGSGIYVYDSLLHYEVQVMSALCVYNVAYFFTRDTGSAIFLVFAVVFLSVAAMLIEHSISDEVSEHGSFLAFAKHCATWLLKMMGAIFLTTPLSLVAVRNAIQCAKMFNALQEEWAYDGLCYKTVVMSVVVSLLFYSCVYMIKQLMKFMD